MGFVKEQEKERDKEKKRTFLFLAIYCCCTYRASSSRINKKDLPPGYTISLQERKVTAGYVQMYNLFSFNHERRRIHVKRCVMARIKYIRAQNCLRFHRASAMLQRAGRPYKGALHRIYKRLLYRLRGRRGLAARGGRR